MAHQLARFCEEVAVLWDEAQDHPALLRFLAPFGRPELPRIVRMLKESASERDVLAEAYPVFATWLATLVYREGKREPSQLPGSEAVRSPTLFGSIEVKGPLLLEPRDTVVVAGSLKAPVIRTQGLLVVAGEVTCSCLIADGCTLIGGDLHADVVSVPATSLRRDSTLKGSTSSIAFLVSGQLHAALYDSPRLAPGGEIDAEVVIRGAGLTATKDWQARAKARLVDASMVKNSGIDFDALAARAARGEALVH